MKTIDRILATAVAAAVGLVGAVTPAYAKLSADEVARLGADLTPVGAEKGPNKDGTIPAWNGGLCSPPAGWAAAKGYTDPFASDKPKFVITKANMAQYRENPLIFKTRRWQAMREKVFTSPTVETFFVPVERLSIETGRDPETAGKVDDLLLEQRKKKAGVR